MTVRMVRKRPAAQTATSIGNGKRLMGRVSRWVKMSKKSLSAMVGGMALWKKTWVFAGMSSVAKLGKRETSL